MIELLVSYLLDAPPDARPGLGFAPRQQFKPEPSGSAEIAASLNAAFLLSLAGSGVHESDAATRFLESKLDSPEWGDVAAYYHEGISRIREELEDACGSDPEFARLLGALTSQFERDVPGSPDEITEAIWSVLFPEASGIRGHEDEVVESLRQRRRVRVTELNPQPVSDPARQILFTSNVLLTVPSSARPPDDNGWDDDFRDALRTACEEPQLYWYDHPIPIGVPTEQNEVLYGLRELNRAVSVERERGNVGDGERVTCVLSVSVTHSGLHAVAHEYLLSEIARNSDLENLDVYIFTEPDVRQLIDDVLAPAVERWLQEENVADALQVLGVDGAYGRHYSFLKAISALWHVLVDPHIEATFKIDLDQVFPQNELIDETGESALEHFRTPLWGANGVDSQGREIELGMIAGALVNERDIHKSLFTPDVVFPDREPQGDQLVFYSALPQAASTNAEMMTRYDSEQLNGRDACLERIHVTGGTNGILVDSLRRHRPFTPSFIGRAEDQAYILSVIGRKPPRLAYLHEPGLIMRHDKEAFAGEAIAAAHVGKLVGDYVRLLFFSAYSNEVADSRNQLKQLIDPFTGCFVSRIPTTVAYLRFALKAASLFTVGDDADGVQFISGGARRIREALRFVEGTPSELSTTYARERRDWDLYYEALDAVESALNEGDSFACDLRERAREIIDGCAVRSGSTT